METVKMLPLKKHQLLILCFFFCVSSLFGQERKPTTTWKKEKEEEPVMAIDRQAKLLWRDAKPDILYYDSTADFWNRRSSSDHFEPSSAVGFSAVRASRDAQLGRLGRVEFDNTLTNLYDWQNSIFQCKNAGLYFFTFAARGRAASARYENDFISSSTSSDEARRIRLQISRSRQADDEACLDWKVSLMLNGESVISIGGLNNTSGSNTVILPLNRGDRVWLQLTRGQLVELNGNSYYQAASSALATFSGYQISSLNNNFFPPSSTASGINNNIDDAIVIPSSRRSYYGNERRRYY